MQVEDWSRDCKSRSSIREVPNHAGKRRFVAWHQHSCGAAHRSTRRSALDVTSRKHHHSTPKRSGLDDAGKSLTRTIKRCSACVFNYSGCRFTTGTVANRLITVPHWLFVFRHSTGSTFDDGLPPRGLLPCECVALRTADGHFAIWSRNGSYGATSDCLWAGSA